MTAHATAARTRSATTATGPTALRPAQQTVPGTQPRGDVQVLAAGATYPDPTDPSETRSQVKAEKADEKAQQKAEKADSKSSKHNSGSKPS